MRSQRRRTKAAAVFNECDDYEPEVASEPTAKKTRKEFLCPNPTCPAGRNQKGMGFTTRLNVKTHTICAKRGGCGLYLCNLSPYDSILSDFIKVIYYNETERYQADYLDFTRV